MRKLFELPLKNNPSFRYMIVHKEESASAVSPRSRASLSVDLDFLPSSATSTVDTFRSPELESRPITESVSVYHCGSSDDENYEVRHEIEIFRKPLKFPTL